MQFKKNNPGCSCCGGTIVECPYCIAGDGPASYTVEVSGMADDGCAECTLLDGTYLVDTLEYTVPSCRWSTEGPDMCSHTTKVTVDVGPAGAQFYVVVYLYLAWDLSNAIYIRYRWDTISFVDCLNLSTLTLPIEIDDTSGRCIGAGATVTVTSV